MYSQIDFLFVGNLIGLFSSPLLLHRKKAVFSYLICIGLQNDRTLILKTRRDEWGILVVWLPVPCYNKILVQQTLRHHCRMGTQAITITVND